MGSKQPSVQSSGGPAFLQQDKSMNDPAVLRKRIAELELENKQLKDKGGGQPMSQSFKAQTGRGGIAQEKNWMNFGSQPLERPTTASQSNDKVRELQEELKMERKDKKKMIDEVENLNRELQKANFSAFT